MVNERIDSLGKQVNKLKKLASFADSEGGRLIKQAYVADIIGTLRVMCGRYHALTHAEFIAYTAQIAEKLQLVETLKGAPGDFALAASDLKEALETARSSLEGS